MAQSSKAGSLDQDEPLIRHHRSGRIDRCQRLRNNGNTTTNDAIRSRIKTFAFSAGSMPDPNEPYFGFNDRVTEEVQARFGSTWELEDYEGQPVGMNLNNLDLSPGPNQVRIYAWFTDWIRDIDQKFSINFDPVLGLLGIIKRSSRQ